MITRHPWNLRHIFKKRQPVSVVTFYVSNAAVSQFTQTTATIDWRLEPVGGTGQVEYGETTAYGMTTALSTAYLTRHVQEIGSGVNPTPLKAGTLYYFRIMSQSASGDWAYSTGTFTTEGAVAEPDPPGETPLAGPRAAPAIPTGANVKTISASIDRTGVTTVTASLQAFINSANAGDILVFDPTGTSPGFRHGVDEPINEYRISGTLYLTNLPDNVTLWGYGTRIRQSGIGNVATFLQNSAGKNGMSFKGFDLFGANSAYSRKPNIYSGLVGAGEGGHGIGWWRRHTNTLVEDCWIHHQAGDGIYQAGFKATDYVSGNGTDRITVRYNRIEDNKRQGVVPNVGTNWLISRNVLGNQGGGNIDCEDVKGSDFTLPKHDAIIEYNVFEKTTWHYDAVFGKSAFHINYSHGWDPNSSDGWFDPPVYSKYGPIVVRNNTVTGYLTAAAPSTAPGLFWTQTNREPNDTNIRGETRMQGLYLEDNVMNLPVAERTTQFRFARVGYTDGVWIRRNVLQNNTITAPLTGTYAHNTNVTISGNT